MAIASRSTFKIGDEEIINSGGLDVMVIKHNSDGDVEWIEKLDGTDWETLVGVTQTTTGKYVASGGFQSDEISNGDNFAELKNRQDGLIVEIEEIEIADVKTKDVKHISGGNQDIVEFATGTTDGGYIIGGEFASDIQIDDITFTNKGNFDGII